MDALFDGQWEILERLAQGAPRGELLEAIVRLIEAQADGMLSSILLLDPRRRTLHHGAAPSLPLEYVRAIDGASIGPTAGSCGAAAFMQQPVIVEDTETHPNWAPWRDLVRRHQLRACWSTPIFSPERKLLGTFAMYYHAPRRPNQTELRWISIATHLASITLTLARQAELEEQLRRSQRMEAVGKLAGGVAHDFNNLLSVIVGYTTMISDSLPESDPLRGDVEEVRRAADRATELTRQLLAFGRRQVMAPQRLDLNAALRELHNMLQRVLGEDIELCLETHARHAWIEVDPSQLEQVVMNLVVNARDAMPGGGELSLGTEDAWQDGDGESTTASGTAPGRYVSLFVQDTGEGMDSATISRIFDPFFTTKAQGKGTGLGLSTVWGIVTQSGGLISVKSAPGAGARFEVRFPVVERPAAPETPRESAPPSTGDETILVVEDEAQVRKLLCSVLRRGGYHVLEGTDGRDGLTVSQRYDGRIHLLLTDVTMPQMNGPELVRALVEQRPETQVLYLSGYTDNALEDAGAGGDSTTVLAKPIAPQELLRQVRRALDGA